MANELFLVRKTSFANTECIFEISLGSWKLRRLKQANYLIKISSSSWSNYCLVFACYYYFNSALLDRTNSNTFNIMICEREPHSFMELVNDRLNKNKMVCPQGSIRFWGIDWLVGLLPPQAMAMVTTLFSLFKDIFYHVFCYIFYYVTSSHI